MGIRIENSGIRVFNTNSSIQLVNRCCVVNFIASKKLNQFPFYSHCSLGWFPACRFLAKRESRERCKRVQVLLPVSQDQILVRTVLYLPYSIGREVSETHLSSAAEQEWEKPKGCQDFYLKHGKSQSQNLALTVVCVLNLLDSSLIVPNISTVHSTSIPTHTQRAAKVFLVGFWPPFRHHISGNLLMSLRYCLHWEL